MELCFRPQGFGVGGGGANSNSHTILCISKVMQQGRMVIFAAWATCVVKSILKDPQAPYGQWNCAKNIRPRYVLKSSFSSHSRGGGSVKRHVHIVYPVKRGVMGEGELWSYVSASRLCRVGRGG